MADRVGVIAKGKLLLVDDKAALMKKLGKRELDLTFGRADDRHTRGTGGMGADAGE